MTDFRQLSEQERREMRAQLMERYREFQKHRITLDMTRGKPCPEQLDLSLGMIEGDTGKAYRTKEGLDCRNYGGLDGIPAAKTLFSEYMEVEPDELKAVREKRYDECYQIYFTRTLYRVKNKTCA